MTQDSQNIPNNDEIEVTPEVEAVETVEAAEETPSPAPVSAPTESVASTPSTPAPAGASAGAFNARPQDPRQSPGGFRGGDRRGGRGGAGGDRRGGGRGGDRRGGPRREPRAKPEFDQKMIDIRRVTRVSAGGRRFTFAVSMVVGDKKGRVGVGTGKGTDTALAVEKAFRDAKKNIITVSTTKSGSIPHEVSAKYCSSRVEIKPAKGKGMVAGSSVRDVIDLAGLKDVNAKLRSGTKNKLNNARAAIKALMQLKAVKSEVKQEARPEASQETRVQAE